MSLDNLTNYKTDSQTMSAVKTKSYAFSLVILLIFVTVLSIINYYNYLLFHSLAELFSIVIAFTIAVIAWNSRSFIGNNYFLLIGISFFFTSFLDIIHTLSYKGMNIFTGYGPGLSVQVWLGSRYLQCLSFLAAPFFINLPLHITPVFITYTSATAFIL